MIRFKKKYRKPVHPWEKQRIIEEKSLTEEFAYKNKREIWRMQAVVKKYRDLAKNLVSIRTKQQTKEKEELLAKLVKLNLIDKGSTVESVLGLTVNDVSNRRLQTIVYKKGFANSTKQARQLITHGHVFVSDRKVTSPSKLLSVKEESEVKVKKLKLDKKSTKKPMRKKEEGGYGRGRNRSWKKKR